MNQFGKWNDETKSYLDNGWNLYLIGMEAGSCGWYELMYTTMKGLCKKVESEACFHWLSALSSLAHAEWTLSKDQTTNNSGYTASVSSKFIESLTQLKSLQLLEKPRTNQLWYIQLRMEMLAAIQHTLSILNQPSIENQTKLIEDCAVMYRKIAFRYDFIAQAQFGIDRETLDVIESYKISALICEHASRTFSGSSRLFFCIDPSLIPLINSQDISPRKLSNRNQSMYMFDLCKEFVRTVTSWDDLDHLDPPDRYSVST